MAKKLQQLKLPSQLLDKLEGHVDDNQWRESHNFSKKRKSRKETRKELRQSKKQKRGKHNTNSAHTSAPPEKSNNEKASRATVKAKPRRDASTNSKNKSDQVLKPFLSAHEEELLRKDEEDARYYAKKLGLKSLKLTNENDGWDDLLGDLDLDNFSDKNSNDEPEALSDSFGSDDSDDGVLSDPEDDGNSDDEGTTMTAEETMAKLAAVKRAKTASSSDSQIRIVKEDELSDSISDSDFGSGLDSDSDGEEMTAEETMAALKRAKENKQRASGSTINNGKPFKGNSNEDDDSFDGFDSDEEEMTAEETMAKLAALKKNKSKDVPDQLGADDDSLSESDFDVDDLDESDGGGEEMTAEETMAKLAALKGKKLGSTQASDHDQSSDEGDNDMDSGSESEEYDDDNPYVPPKRRGATSQGPDTSVKAKENSEEIQALRRVFKSSLNKLTESTLPQVTHDIELSFLKYSRAEASNVLTDQILELVGGRQALQPTMYTVYAALIADLYQSVGIGFAAYLVQVIVEKTLANLDEGSNLMNLLMECYAFHLVSSRLPYDLLKHLLTKIDSPENLAPVELFLIIIRNGGSQLRSDDPVALKEVIILLQKQIQQLGGADALPARVRFVVDSIVALKNNRQKPLSESVVALRHRLRKALLNKINKNKSGDVAKEPMQVGLSDILDSETRGKWWLVGASWKGNTNGRSGTEAEYKLDIDMDDEFGSSTPDWLELAKKQRLNTDVRRAVFVALMGAEDYLDACLRIDKLGLKNKQERDVPHVVLHCLVQEPYYNPYYALVASKQCARHSTMKTFQFRLWDWLNSEPSGNPQVAMHYGRFYGSLVSQRVMPLDILKMVDFLGGSADVQIFSQFFCVTLYKELAKQAEKLAKTSMHSGLSKVHGSEEVDRDGKEIVLMLSKVREPTVLRGLQIVNKTLPSSEAIQTAKDRDRVVWAAQFISDIIDELVRKTD